MSLALAKQFSAIRICAKQSSILSNISFNFEQVRTATKKVSGSKTNKNDSAGRRLGPKALEGHLVRTGQIIMRQRGTKIHPGENVGIGKDHTIFALEPGYVRFYYDPFHPLRKYVGVALKKEITLPSPHFAPRVRRFGYEPTTKEDIAEKEEKLLPRKASLLQAELAEETRLRELKIAKITSDYEVSINKFQIEYNDLELKVLIQRLVEIAQLKKAGLSSVEAKDQATYNFLTDLQLSAQSEKITKDELKNSTDMYNLLVLKTDTVVDIDAQGKLCAYLDADTRHRKQVGIKDLLDTKYFNKVLTVEDRTEILSLIQSPGVFDITAQAELQSKYLPKVLPYDVPGSVIDIKDSKNIPEGFETQRIFDIESRKTRFIGRPKEAFA